MQETQSALQEFLARRSSTSGLQRFLQNTLLQMQGKPNDISPSEEMFQQRIVLNRMIEVVDSIYSESQRGFRAGRGTVDIIFTMRQTQEKCREQNLDLYMVFIDLTKAFDTVNSDGLWTILRRFCGPE